MPQIYDYKPFPNNHRLSEENLSLHVARLSKQKQQSIDNLKMQLQIQGSETQARTPSESNANSMTNYTIHVLDDDENMDDPNDRNRNRNRKRIRNRNSNSTNDNDVQNKLALSSSATAVQRKHTKDLSNSHSGLVLQNIVKHNLIRPHENSDSNLTSNSKAVVINATPIDDNDNTNRYLKEQQSSDIIQPYDDLELNRNDKDNANPQDMNVLAMDLNTVRLSRSPNPDPKPEPEPEPAAVSRSGSAIDLLKAHKPRGQSRDVFPNYLETPGDNNGSVRSSIMSLEDILQERGLYRKDEKEKIRQARDVPLDNNKKKKINEQLKQLQPPSPQNQSRSHSKNKNKKLKSPQRNSKDKSSGSGSGSGSESMSKPKSRSKKKKEQTSSNSNMNQNGNVNANVRLNINMNKTDTNQNHHVQQPSASITDSRSLLNLLEYQSDDINKYNYNNNTNSSHHTLNTNITDKTCME